MADVISTGVRLYSETFGDGPPVLLIPGTNMPPVTFQLEVVPALVDAGYSVVLMGNRGMEPSEAPPGPYSVAELADDAAAVIEAAALGPCHVVGYSLGGNVAEELCYRRPDLVRDVALIASAGRTSSFLRAYIRAEIDLAMNVDPPLASQVVRDTLLFVYPSAVLQDDDATVDFMNEMISSAPPWTNPGRLGQWAANLAWADDELRTERWAHLEQRCLAMAFEHDVAWPPSRVREAAAAMPNARLEVIAGAAHGGVLTHGAAVSAALVAFLPDTETPKTSTPKT